jgi:hypothetical protein
MRLLEGDYRVVVLVVLLVQLAKQAPGLRALLVVLDLRLEAENGLLNLALLDELLRLAK